MSGWAGWQSGWAGCLPGWVVYQREQRCPLRATFAFAFAFGIRLWHWHWGLVPIQLARHVGLVGHVQQPTMKCNCVCLTMYSSVSASIYMYTNVFVYRCPWTVASLESAVSRLCTLRTRVTVLNPPKRLQLPFKGAWSGQLVPPISKQQTANGKQELQLQINVYLECSGLGSELEVEQLLSLKIAKLRLQIKLRGTTRATRCCPFNGNC